MPNSIDPFGRGDVFLIIKICYYKRLAYIIYNNPLYLASTNFELYFIHISHVFQRQTKPFNQFTKNLKILFHLFEIVYVFPLNS